MLGKLEAERGERSRADTNEPPKRNTGFLQQCLPATRGSLGVDVETTVDVTLVDSNVQKVPSNVIGPLVHQESNVGGLLLGRSSAGIQGLIVLPGVIDADYTGRIYIMVYTVCPPVFIPKGSKIAQIVAISNPLTHMPQSNVRRGNQGFGSTGPAVCFTTKLNQRPTMKITITQQGTSQQIDAMLDTGADVTIISRNIWPSSWPVELPTSSIAGVGGQSVPYISKHPIHLQFLEGQHATLKVYVLPLPGTSTNRARCAKSNWSRSDNKAFLVMGTGEQPPNPSLTWLTNEPVWVDQWPMTKERLQIAKQLVAEQLAAGHIKPSVSPWNTPIFVIPKKSGKWRLLHDLRKVNDQMQSMGALQPGMPSLSMLPHGWHILIVDLKDCFFTIPLHPQDTQRFAFSVPTVNKAAPAERYEWVVLPQGMKNSPTLCQLYVAWALQPLRAQWSNTIIYHYMDDILCCREQPFSDESLRQLITILAKKGLVIAPEKVQHTAPWKYLGWSITDSKIRPQKTELVTQLHTLHDIQTLLGDIQWVRNCVGISNTDIAPLTALLRGTNPADKVTLTMEHHTVLQQIIQKMHAAWSSRRILPLPISLIVCNGKDSPYAVICQWQNKKGELTSTFQLNATATAKCKGQGDMFNILEWVFLSVQPKRSIQTRTEAVGELIRKGWSRIIEISGQEPEDISIPVSTVEVEWWLRNAEAIQNALLGYGGKIHSQQPQGKLWQMLRQNQWIQRSKVSNNPLPDGVTVYTDAGKRLRRAACVWKEGNNWKQYVMEGQPQDSLQTLELTAVIWALTNWINIPLNVVTDSMYVAGIVPRLEDALLRETTNPRLGSLFIRLRSVLGQRTAACCIIHIRSHQLDLGLGQGHGPVWVPSRNVKPVLTPHGSSDKQDEPTPDHRDSTPGGDESSQN
ncbi:LOW QUALITY PROTEIN: hypothetical protein QYF61_027306 [Mycteria americana]|uniref:ribonuclease H n=1 Tax=Mycteria americana TaxID=33587 RepID=A0AAN7MJJ6_MYCAM|nr:LOW QUALITY PROTEIN: hypothetical protein QYF61_027306 [Mycteria americana]